MDKLEAMKKIYEHNEEDYESIQYDGKYYSNLSNHVWWKCTNHQLPSYLKENLSMCYYGSRHIFYNTRDMEQLITNEKHILHGYFFKG